MRRVPLRLAGTGLALGRPLVRPDGAVLLGAGTPLDPRTIDRLSGLGYRAVHAEDPACADVALPDPIDSGPLARLLDALFRGLRDAARAQPPPPPAAAGDARVLRRFLKDVGAPGVVRRVQLAAALPPAVESLLDALPDPHRLRARVAPVRGSRSRAVDHAIESAILGVTMSRAGGLARTDQRDMATGLLLHDAGLALLPPDAAEDRRSLHGELGHLLLLDVPEFAGVPARIALEHADRTRVPQGPSGLAAAANAFDRRLSDGEAPATALRRTATDRWIPPAASALLTEVVTPWPAGTTVSLPDGRFGVVVRGGDRPAVRLLDGSRTLDAPEGLTAQWD